MPKCMHLVPGMTTLSTKKSKVKITKAKMLQFREDHKLHNKEYKHDKHLAPLMVMDFDTYLKYRFGKLKPKKKKSEEWKPAAMPNIVDDRKVQVKVEPHACIKKPPKVYDGERKLIGIGMLHKSNLIPIFDKEHAIDIAKMRR